MSIYHYDDHVNKIIIIIMIALKWVFIIMMTMIMGMLTTVTG